MKITLILTGNYYKNKKLKKQKISYNVRIIYRMIDAIICRTKIFEKKLLSVSKKDAKLFIGNGNGPYEQF